MAFALCGELLGRYYSNIQIKTEGQKAAKTITRYAPLMIGALLDCLFSFMLIGLSFLIWINVIGLPSTSLWIFLSIAVSDLSLFFVLTYIFLNSKGSKEKSSKNG